MNKLLNYLFISTLFLATIALAVSANISNENSIKTKQTNYSDLITLNETNTTRTKSFSGTGWVNGTGSGYGMLSGFGSSHLGNFTGNFSYIGETVGTYNCFRFGDQYYCTNGQVWLHSGNYTSTIYFTGYGNFDARGTGTATLTGEGTLTWGKN